MYWLQHPIKLEGKKVKLQPLDYSHFDELIAIGNDPEIWQYLPVDDSDSNALLRELKSAVLKRSGNEQYPFVIIDKTTNNIIGSTRLYNIFPEHKKLEIGWTWYAPAYWGTGHNTECKYLLLSHCFETLGAIRVQLQTNEQNMRSRAAILKIGAAFEGILRNDRLKPDGTKRNTAIFSIIDSEWQQVKSMLENQIKEM